MVPRINIKNCIDTMYNTQVLSSEMEAVFCSKLLGKTCNFKNQLLRLTGKTNSQ